MKNCIIKIPNGQVLTPKITSEDMLIDVGLKAGMPYSKFAAFPDKKVSFLKTHTTVVDTTTCSADNTVRKRRRHYESEEEATIRAMENRAGKEYYKTNARNLCLMRFNDVLLLWEAEKGTLVRGRKPLSRAWWGICLKCGTVTTFELTKVLYGRNGSCGCGWGQPSVVLNPTATNYWEVYGKAASLLVGTYTRSVEKMKLAEAQIGVQAGAEIEYDEHKKILNVFRMPPSLKAKLDSSVEQVRLTEDSDIWKHDILPFIQMWDSNLKSRPNLKKIGEAAYMVSLTFGDPAYDETWVDSHEAHISFEEDVVSTKEDAEPDIPATVYLAAKFVEDHLEGTEEGTVEPVKQSNSHGLTDKMISKIRALEFEYPDQYKAYQEEFPGVFV